jgi:hypothetical protein
MNFLSRILFELTHWRKVQATTARIHPPLIEQNSLWHPQIVDNDLTIYVNEQGRMFGQDRKNDSIRFSDKGTKSVLIRLPSGEQKVITNPINIPKRTFTFLLVAPTNFDDC